MKTAPVSSIAKKYWKEVKSRGKQEIADLLLADTDGLVQKGYGWLLKEASRKHTDEVFSYVMANKRVMPRTALRYAIELMPKDLREEAMKKDW